jgi:thioredoxin reductase (NADPH)
MEKTVYDVIIIGSGPSGLTAAIYTTRANLKTLVIAGVKWGGQLMLTTLVENFPGFPEGVMGPELMINMRKQAEHFGAEIVNTNFKNADFTQSKSGILTVTTDEGKTYEGKTVIVATGADTKWLDVPGEKEKIGRGVASCAPCDAAFYRNKRVIVVGGGDSAMEEATVLTRFASHVWLVHRRDSFRASAAMQEKVFKDPKITVVYNTQVEEVMGEIKVEKVRFKTTGNNLLVQKMDKSEAISAEELEGINVNKTDTDVTWEFPVDGVFVAIGHIPNSQVFKGIDTDEKGFIKVYEHTKTNMDRVFVAGDIHDTEYKQAITAAGFGCMAALEVEKFLRMEE